jgi:hypothetical protein
MKKHFVVLLCAAIMIFAFPVLSQISGTNLIMGAHWDNNNYIQGTVQLSKVNLIGADTLIATKPLSQGWTNMTQILAPNSVYNVTLLASNGTQLVKFPFTTALINPSNLQSAEIDLVCHAADYSLASARISVKMTF